jgi:two-component system OmpR family response regulator
VAPGSVPEPAGAVAPVAVPAVGVCEDDEQLREILRVALERHGMTVRVTGTGHEAVQAFPALSLQAIVLDIGLPDADGRDVCQALRARGVQTPVLFLTARDVLADRLSGFHAGGDDYLTKPFAISELLVRITALVRRSGEPIPGADRAPRLAPAPAAAGPDIVLDPSAHALVLGEHRVALTPTEFRLLALLAAQPGVVLRRNQLLNAGWPEGAMVHANTLDSYMARIRRKLAEARAPDAIETVRGVGYRLR